MTRVLQGRNAIITGANQGLGLELARAYVDAGASVFLCARDASLLARAKEELLPRTQGRQQVLAMPADISDERQVNQVVAEAMHAFGDLHILVNNAGVYGPLGPIAEVNWDLWTQAIAINLFGSVLMYRAVIPHFTDRKYGKVIQLSGGGATNPLPRFSAYAASKAAVVRMAETLAEEVRYENIDVNSIAPGALNTRLLDEVLAAGPDVVGKSFFERSLKQKGDGGAPMFKGAALAVFLASAASDGITGKLLSAIWDPWEELPSHIDDLKRTDVYTLRRIVPADRDLNWGRDDD